MKQDFEQFKRDVIGRLAMMRPNMTMGDFKSYIDFKLMKRLFDEGQQPDTAAIRILSLENARNGSQWQ